MRSGCGSSAAANGVVELGAPDDDAPLVTLIEDPDAPLRPRGTTGLFHLALLVPDRAELARALNRVTATGHRFTGASDHLVSEALYLDDPEGNGIEIYRDRPREEWPRAEGELQMATLPLDLEGVLASAPAGDAGEGMAAGHDARSRAPAGRVDSGGGCVLHGRDRVRRRRCAAIPGALFVSAGGYHHHIGLNTWAGEGAPAPPLGARGLRSYTIVLPDEAALQQTLAAARDAGIEAGEDEDGRTVVADPSGNRAVLAMR